MATTTNITTTYAGESAGKYIAAALLQAKTLDQQLIDIRPNIKYKSVMKKGATSDIVKDATCDFDPSGTVTITERILEPKELQVNMDICKTPFQEDWDAISMGYSATDTLPKTFTDFILAQVLGQVAQATENSIWGGSAAVNGEFDGIETMIALDANLPAANEVSGTTVTSSNVLVEIAKIVDAMPAALYGRDDIMIYVSQNIHKAYVRALAGYGTSGLGASGVDNKGNLWYSNGQNLTFDGIPVVLAPGLSSSVAFLTYKENFAFGTGLMSDMQQVKLIDMADIDGSKNVRVVLRYTAGVQYGVVADIVTYGITNSAN